MNIVKQYNDFSDEFSSAVQNKLLSRNEFYKIINTLNIVDKKILDVGCGDGIDLLYYHERKGIVSGCDASEELIKIAQSRLPENNICVGLFENLPFKDDEFDFVFSKYALQTSIDIHKSIKEMNRVLKKGGELIFLVVHPIRQFLEKRKGIKIILNKRM